MTQRIHDTWRNSIEVAKQAVAPAYLSELHQNPDWIPGPAHYLNAFCLPKPAVKYVLIGESPYPRANSANGLAFWDAAVGNLWSDTGLSKPINRATSLRNIMKMLLLADGQLTADNLTQPAIAALDKSTFIQTNDELFEQLLSKGFLLLNASLVFRPGKVKQDAKAWLPFVQSILQSLQSQAPTLLLFGRIAETINTLEIAAHFPKIVAPHPYNLSFITHKSIIQFFKPLTLLKKSARMDISVADCQEEAVPH